MQVRKWTDAVLMEEKVRKAKAGAKPMRQREIDPKIRDFNASVSTRQVRRARARGLNV